MINVIEKKTKVYVTGQKSIRVVSLGIQGPAGPLLQLKDEPLIGIIDNENKIFTTTDNYIAGSTMVFINGLRQRLNVHYTESAEKTITFSDAPLLTGFEDDLFITYQKREN